MTRQPDHVGAPDSDLDFYWRTDQQFAARTLTDWKLDHARDIARRRVRGGRSAVLLEVTTPTRQDLYQLWVALDRSRAGPGGARRHQLSRRPDRLACLAITSPP